MHRSGVAQSEYMLALRTPWTVWKGKKIQHERLKTPRLVGIQYATREECRYSYRNNEESEPKWKLNPVVDMSGDESKVRCCKEQCCTGTWNLRSMNQGKLDMIKQKMVKVNIDTLGISELKRTGMGELSSDDHYIYYCGQESFRRNGVGLIFNRRVQSAVLGINLKNDRMISICFQGKPFCITVILV